MTAVNTTAGRPERRRLVALDGDYLAGKTSALLQLAAELQEAEPPQPVATEQYRTVTQPVVYLQCPSDGERGLVAAILRAMECPVPERGNTSSMLETAARIAGYRQVRVIILDDANLLQASRRSEALTAFLRRALQQLPATLVFAGKGLMDGPLAAARRGSAADEHAARQLAHRTIAVDVAPPIGRGRDAGARWAGLVTGAADQYLLARDPTGTLTAADLHRLYDLAGGRPGHLFEILGTAAAWAVGRSETLDSQSIQHARTALSGSREAAS